MILQYFVFFSLVHRTDDASYYELVKCFSYLKICASWAKLFENFWLFDCGFLQVWDLKFGSGITKGWEPRVVNEPTSSGRIRKYTPKPGPNSKTNLNPKSCPKNPEAKLGLKNLAMLPSYFDYIFVHLRQKTRLRPELSTKFLSNFEKQTKIAINRCYQAIDCWTLHYFSYKKNFSCNS